MAFFVIGCYFLSVVSVHPLGLWSAYPEPPISAINGPLGKTSETPTEKYLRKRKDETVEEYLARLTHQVAAGIPHYWPAGQHTRPSILHNYILWSMPLISSNMKWWNEYEFASPKLALERGYGFCSQVSRIVYAILRDQDIPARVIQHPNHVLVEVAGSILDADYGVYIPHSAKVLQRTPELIAPYYSNHAGAIEGLKKIYGHGWERSFTQEEFDRTLLREEFAEIVKWFPPLIIMVLGGVFIMIERRNKYVP